MPIETAATAGQKIEIFADVVMSVILLGSACGHAYGALHASDIGAAIAAWGAAIAMFSLALFYHCKSSGKNSFILAVVIILGALVSIVGLVIWALP